MYKKLLIALIICVLCLSPIAAENWNSFWEFVALRFKKGKWLIVKAIC